MVLVFNKTDVKDEQEAVEWMRDFEAFQKALKAEEEAEMEGGSSGYMNSLLNSMSLVLEEFYNALSVVGVSSMTGHGIPDFFAAVEGKREEFERDYKPEMEKRVKDAEAQKAKAREREVSRMMGDMGVSSRKLGTGKYAADKKKGKEEPETVSEAEEMDEDDDDEGMEGDSENDDGEEEGEGEFDEDGLKERYRQALRESGSGGGAGGAGRGVGKAADYIMRSQR